MGRGGDLAALGRDLAAYTSELDELAHRADVEDVAEDLRGHGARAWTMYDVPSPGDARRRR